MELLLSFNDKKEMLEFVKLRAEKKVAGMPGVKSILDDSTYTPIVAIRIADRATSEERQEIMKTLTEIMDDVSRNYIRSIDEGGDMDRLKEVYDQKAREAALDQ